MSYDHSACMHACTMIIVHACNMMKVRSRTMIIVHVPVPRWLCSEKDRTGGLGEKSTY